MGSDLKAFEQLPNVSLQTVRVMNAR